MGSRNLSSSGEYLLLMMSLHPNIQETVQDANACSTLGSSDCLAILLLMKI